jgi:hypothetical protein
VKGVGEGVLEYRINFGPGYRVYFGRDGNELVILLTGGTKKRQQRDISTAIELWTDYRRRRRGAPLPVEFLPYKSKKEPSSLLHKIPEMVYQQTSLDCAKAQIPSAHGPRLVGNGSVYQRDLMSAEKVGKP